MIIGILLASRFATTVLAGSPVDPVALFRVDVVVVFATTLPLWLALLDVYSRLRHDPVEAFRRRALATSLTCVIATSVLLSVVEREQDRILLEMAATFGLVFALLPYTSVALNRFLAPAAGEPAPLVRGAEDAGSRTTGMPGASPQAWHTLDKSSGTAGRCGLAAPRLRPAGRSQTQVLLKWFLDKTLGTIALVFFLPLILFCVIAIKLADPGPAFYSQIRVGRDGKPIRVWKLRTMYVDAEQRLEAHLASDPGAARQWDLYCKLHDDPRIIPVVGSLLRKTSMDEVPQLFCVLNGSMSMVGPRPFPVYHVEKFPEDFQGLRRSVLPGLTGLWQISFRSDGDLTRQRLADTYYIRNWSIWLDLYIIMRTPLCLFSGKGAY